MLFLSSGNLLIILFWMICALPCWRIAKLANQSQFKWLGIGLFGGPFALIAATLMEDKRGKLSA
ncbi:MAG: hypothetical protein ACP5N7_06490 [Candidatus Pacearchaeota archaeon]